MGFLDSAWGFLKKGASFVGNLFSQKGGGSGWGNLARKAYNAYRDGTLMPTIKDMGTTAVDALLTNASNAIFDGTRNYANKYLTRAFPTLVDPTQRAGEKLKNRLQSGYRELLYGKNGAPVGQGGGGLT